jgi:hypothetical protein
MNYKEMLEHAKSSGVTSEKAMWQSVGDIDTLLCLIKETNKDAYHQFMRKTYANLYSDHYATEDFAEWDISQMKSTQMDGKTLSGAYWTIEQVVDAYKSMGVTIPSEVTKYDLWVLANAAKHDFGRKFDDSKVLEIGYLFYVADEDYPKHDKIFRYMTMVHSKEV